MNTDDWHDSPWSSYYGPNLGYVQEQYEQYLADPDSVNSTFRELFATWGAPPADFANAAAGSKAPSVPNDPAALKKVMEAHHLVLNIRRYGHLAADIYPLDEKRTTAKIDPATYGLTKQDLAAMPASLIWENAPLNITNGLQAVERLTEIYTNKTAYEFSHIQDESELHWLNQHAETSAESQVLTAAERTEVLDRLIQVEQFENYLHKTFAGQKRFSIEGVDMLVPAMDEIIRLSIQDGAENILVGMAHRGRLSVLAHVLKKPYAKILGEFYHPPLDITDPSELDANFGMSGDVKYHQGAVYNITDSGETKATITLANNPSHLEVVDPVVEGFTRAAQEDRSQPGFPKQDVSKAIAITVHGDAAFPGEGVVTETLNFNNLRGYTNGGTIHIITNNRIGFTTNSEDSRSTMYSSDVAKGFDIPIIHVNADDPDACIQAIRIAYEYRKQFKKDFVIDMIGYRRHGHNEGDDPEGTQPLVYSKVRKHPTVAALYANTLVSQKAVTEQQVAEMKRQSANQLQQAYEQMREEAAQGHHTHVPRMISELQAVTGVPLERLNEINQALLNRPEGFTEYPKLARILQRRGTMLNEGEKVDWGLGETLAFATILADGTPIRLTGQDSERGTFSHRHVILNDQITGEKFSPLHAIPQAKASFAIHNSPLTETAVLGFEYGYNVFSPETLVMWEAQFGDFANMAQSIFDQFIAAGESKWGQKSNLVVLLPHGFEGQGPEHSSARLERYLQMCAENNWTVANLSSSAQYFHLLRRQAAQLGTEHARPLILMTPKSLLRNPRAASPAAAFGEGSSFQPIVAQPGLGAEEKEVKRIVLCSGRIALDLEEALPAEGTEWLHIIRVEQLYPLPQNEIKAVFDRYKNVEEIVWVQEEPKNMGAWTYMEPRLRELAPKKAAVRYIGRPDRSSPAVGSADEHSVEQKWIINTALNGEAYVKGVKANV
ncbi:2-oxoglutarate dehydrogenase E1 component [Paenibacillus protaetiae]|uniref:2-oxoglutarate dehydrogenase E1 component n=1 Tax=Paenibacillus protaetiae TaxID=2509456 RepID=A0A4P6F0Z6_9BACL|nr:2-oxoglutarate dehydrogenase E1 component [Paenibacillus protaetiae]QAY66687.1 2-oxoglutarate dehydrogenase E1 component [Paenibacillus protaetiae]